MEHDWLLLWEDAGTTALIAKAGSAEAKPGSRSTSLKGPSALPSSFAEHVWLGATPAVLLCTTEREGRLSKGLVRCKAAKSAVGRTHCLQLCRQQLFQAGSPS